MGTGAALRACSTLGLAFRAACARGRGARRSGVVGLAGCATVGAFCPKTFNPSWVLLCFAIVSIVYGVSIVYVHYTSIRKGHQGNRELQDFLAGGRVARRPPLADRVLVALAIA